MINMYIGRVSYVQSQKGSSVSFSVGVGAASVVATKLQQRQQSQHSAAAAEPVGD